ncbi:MAG TPA: hypothetical protein PKM25_17945, partial [Candidatus Ozemobacteraceae bacterium]|nr:hypothetical protein [Candidatus Ozemobacteraceae bacterium]
MAVEKKASQVFLGIGYLFVAAIILINYIGQRPDSRAGGGSAGTFSPAASSNETEMLKKQLGEERRVNGEMRKMLDEMQSFMGRSGVTPQGLPEGNPIRLSAAEVDRVCQEGLPDVSSIRKTPKTKTSPFTVGKNPFVPFYGYGKASKAVTAG